MSKIQSIVCLFILLIVIFSMSMMFSKNISETFINGTGLGYIGKNLNRPMNAKPNNRNGNIGYEGAGYIGVANPPRNYVIHSDDQPLSYGFPSSSM